VAVREILLYPHRALKTPARELAAHDAAETERATTDLLDTMRSFGHCLGLAAPQLGDLVRIAAVDVTGHKKATTQNGPLVLVNPRVVAAEGAEVAREGCLSIPHLTANVRRATRIEVVADGGLHVESAGFEARCILHELDHLDGILFLDRVDSLSRDVFRRKRYR
jgi:peptide deformylase